jgi:serine/threonine-protein kinase
MAVFTATDFLAALRSSSLLTDAQLEAAASHPAAREGAPYDLAQHLEQSGQLTRFQVEQVLRGQGEQLTLGPYRLLDRLGKGGLGEAYKARYAALDKPVTFKRLHIEQFANPAARQEFFDRSMSAAHLSHPHLAGVRDAGLLGETPYLAREFVPGVDLDRVVRETGPLTVARACDAVRQAALGLQHAHDGGMLHGDVRPGHLIVCPVGDVASAPTAEEVKAAPGVMVKVIDLGANPAAPRTLAYAAPELCLRVAAPDARADLYGLGATLYFLLTGRPPFADGRDVSETMQAVVADAPAPLESLRPDVPAAVTAIVRKLMAKKPADRFATAAELAAALEPFCHDIPDAHHTDPAPAADAWPGAPASNGDGAHAPVWPVPATAEHEHEPADLPWNVPHTADVPADRAEAQAGSGAQPRSHGGKGRWWIVVGLFLHLTAVAILLYAFFPEVLVSIGIPIDIGDKTVQEPESPSKKSGPKLEKRKTAHPPNDR